MTAHYPHHSEGGNPVAIAYCIGKLNGEAGETSEAFWKYMRDEGELVKLNATTKRQVIDELGDALWYISALASELGISMETVAGWNLEKLSERAKHGVDGWSEARKAQVLGEQMP